MARRTAQARAKRREFLKRWAAIIRAAERLRDVVPQARGAGALGWSESLVAAMNLASAAEFLRRLTPRRLAA